MAMIAPIRPSPLAGRWYQDNPKALALSVDQYLNQAELPELPGKVIAVIAPHAGHIYSGPVAGYAFAAVRAQTPELVAILSPMHQPAYEPLLTSAHSAYETPLGPVPVDTEAVAELDTRLKDRLGYGLTRVAYDQEHSLEIELPFLQQALGSEFKLLPVMVRSQAPKVCQELGATLAGILQGKNVLLVASTDLSHYYPQKDANLYDAEMLRQVEAFSPEGVFRTEKEEKGFACGLGALAAVLWAARELGGDQVRVLRHATSGDVTGDYSSVVGYGAAVVLKTSSS